mgnify:CR=1 FL=1
MKQIIIIVGTIVIIFIAAMTIVSVESKDLRTDELNRAVSASTVRLKISRLYCLIRKW